MMVLPKKLVINERSAALRRAIEGPAVAFPELSLKGHDINRAAV
jgi:hypothetical protein